MATVGGVSPFTAGCSGSQTGFNYRNAPVEPFVAVDPSRPEHLVAAWQQDRFSDGGANGLLSAVSMDGGRTWTSSFAHFSICSGGSYTRASDPWVTISPDGTAYQVALAFNTVVNGNASPTGILASRSVDGGFTWGEPVPLVLHANGGDDKESITADPNDSHFVYAIWDRGGGNNTSAWFSRTTDGGVSWEAARIILTPAANSFATAHQIVVLKDGTLVDVFVLSGGTTSNVAVMRSPDHGSTWSAPIVVSGDMTIGTVDANTQAGLRTGAGIPSASVDGVSGAIYVVWSDARFSGGKRDGIVLSKSLDGGLTWSSPVQVNQAPNVQAFTPTVSAGAGGSVAVTYYDFRQDTGSPNMLLANYWRIVSRDGGTTWMETPVAGPFDLLSAPLAGGSPFLGDYQGLAATGDQFLAFYVAANSGNAANPTGVFATSRDREPDTRITLRTEVNLHPRPMRAGEKPEPKRK